MSKRSNRILALLCSLAMLFTLIPISASAAVGDVLVDLGFEGDENPYYTDGEVALMELSDAYAATGNQSLHLKITNTGQNWYGIMLDNDKLAEPGMQPTGRYRLTCKVLADPSFTGTNIRTRARVDTMSNGSYNWEASTQDITLTRGVWVNVSFEFEIYKYHDTVYRIGFVNIGRSAAFDIYIDDVKLEVVQEPVPVVQPTWQMNIPSLAEIYKDYFLFGNIMEPGIMDNEGTVKMFEYQYNAMSGENCMKPDGMVRLNADGEKEYTFENADKLVDWANSKGIAVHGHTLVWHSQSPTWLTRDINNGNAYLTRAQAKANLEEHIMNVAGHYADRVVSWDVVNEAVSGGSYGNANANTGSPWRRAYANGMDTTAGEAPDDYIYDAFMFTRKYDPNATLYYNDFNDHLSSNRTNISNMVRKFNDRWMADTVNNPQAGNYANIHEYIAAGGRLLIEGVGMQAHYWVGEASSLINNVKAAIDIYRTLGVKISVTELDIPGGNGGTISPTDDAGKATQARLYAQLFELYMANADIIERVTLWGRNDSTSWRGGVNGTATPQLFGVELEAKTAFWAVVDPAVHLGKKAVDNTPLLETIAAAEALDRLDYKGSSWDILLAAIADAKIAADSNLTLPEVYVAKFVLKGVMDNLITYEGATSAASVEKLKGNKNNLTVVITEAFSDGSTETISVTVEVDNNAIGTYKVGRYTVYVNTKGNDQIRECYIVE